MRRDRWLPADDAVSPVVGSVLLVGIAVTVMSVLAVFVLGFATGGGAPNAEFMFSQEADNNTRITLTSETSIDADRVSVLVDSEPACFNDSESDWNGTIEPSESALVVDADDPDCSASYQLRAGDVVRVVWTSPSSDVQRVIGEWTVFHS